MPPTCTPQGKNINAFIRTACTIGIAALVASASAQTQRPSSVYAISPLYSQLVGFSLPKGFQTVFEKDSGPTYIREAVLKGETVEQWTQMISLTAAKDLAANPQVTPRGFVGSIADGFQKACPKTFTATVMSEGQLETGQLAFTALLDCGSVGAGAQIRRETLLVTAILGRSDVYSLQWAERTRPVDSPPPADVVRWNARLKTLLPIRVCDRVPGEAEPYPSCLSAR